MAISYINKTAGVYFTETDLTAYSVGSSALGACVITPTVKGKSFVPTYVSSFQEFSDFFGTTFKSGSDYYEYQGSLLAKEYFANGGDTLLVVPICFTSLLKEFVTIDDSAETIDRGELQVKVEIIPVKAIEKIVINLVLRETGATFV